VASDDLVIRISGDVKNYQDALDEASSSTEALSGLLSSTAKISAVAFAALTAEIGLSVAAYAESEAATERLTQSLITQGIYSKELVADYERQANALADLTGISDESIMSAQSTIQAYLGQQKVTDELTLAIADLAAAKQMDMDTTAEMIGKAINGQTTALKKLGIEIDDNLSKQERHAAILEQVALKYGGMAEAGARGLGVFKLVGQQFDNLQELIGKKFAPMVEFAGKQIVTFLKYLQDPAVVDFISKMLVFGVTAAGLATAVSTLGVAFLALKAILIAAGVAFSALAAPVAIAVVAIGGIAYAVMKAYENWSVVLPAMQAMWAGFVKGIANLAEGLGKIMMGALALDAAKIKEGWDQMSDSLSQGMDEYNVVFDQKLKESRDIEAAHEADRVERNRVAAEEHANSKKAQRDAEFEQFLVDNEEYQALTEEQQAVFREKNAEMFRQERFTEKTERENAAQEKLKTQIKDNNTYLENQRKYGTAYAMINQIMHSEIYQGSKKAFGELAQLQQSSNSTLKEIGKTAAIANIIIKTAESAMSIYAGFSTIPIIGPALGIAGAAAAVAFGAEQVQRVTAASDGGLLSGGMPGVDSIPVLAQRNELISPAYSFEEVIGSVRAMREAEKLGANFGDPFSDSGGGGNAQITIGFDGREASQVLTVRQIEDRALGVSQEAG
jgi:hypothetical protein